MPTTGTTPTTDPTWPAVTDNPAGLLELAGHYLARARRQVRDAEHALTTLTDDAGDAADPITEATLTLAAATCNARLGHALAGLGHVRYAIDAGARADRRADQFADLLGNQDPPG